MNKLTIVVLVGLVTIMSIIIFNFNPKIQSGVCKSVGCCKVDVKSCSNDCTKSCCLKL